MSDDKALYIDAQTHHIVAGATNAVYFPIKAGLLQSTINYDAGGSLLMMIGPGSGGTLTAAELAGYHSSLTYAHIKTAVGHDIGGPAGFYLAAIGATGVCHVIREYSSLDAT